MSKLRKMKDAELARLLLEIENEEMQMQFVSLGKGNRYYYSDRQKDFALSLINDYGVRGTARMLLLPRRTIQRWCRRYGKQVKRCPSWVYDWAERRRKKREFWERRGYY